MFCAKCGTKNEDTATTCSQCQYPLSPITEDESPLSQEAMYKALIGPKNQEYYLNEFAKFDAAGKTSTSWHWPAFFVTFYWLLYRKMWPTAVLYYFTPTIAILIIAVLGGVFGAIFGFSTSAGIFVCVLYLAYLVASFILPAMHANALYYKHCKKEIARITARKANKQKTIDELIYNGGTSWIAIIFIVFYIFCVIGLMASIAIPAYQEYTIKAKIAEALTVEKLASQSVTNYYQKHQALPQNLAQAGFVKSPSPSIESIEIDQDSGVITMTMATTPIKDQTLILVPTLDDLEQITWVCQSEDIQNQYLPSECKQAAK
jgi:hypothetical protein